MGGDRSTAPPPSCPACLAALHSFISFTSSISFTSNSLRTLLHNGRSSTPLQSIRYALFSSRRGCTPPRVFNCLCPTPYPLSPFFSNSCALFCISLHFFALTKNSTHFFSSDSALFAKNTWGEGGATNPRFPRLAFLHCIR